MATFIFKEHFYDPTQKTAFFRYQAGDFSFEEKLVFHDAPDVYDQNALDQALFAIHLALGISYYKTVPAAKIEGVLLSDKQARFWENFYFKGLGEFRYINQITLKGKIRFPSTPAACATPSALSLPERCLIPVGGGKDSVVSIEALKPFNPLLFSLNASPAIDQCIEISGLSSVRISRSVDPFLIQLSKEKKVLSGHVPVTAMMMFILTAAAVLYGFNAAAFSNERSANSGNAVFEGEEINHQWAKSFEAEKMCQAYIRDNVLQNFTCFSLLRQLSELSIAKLFVPLSPYHFAFISCNRQFALTADHQTYHWCGQCPKCAFTFLILAPFMKKDHIVRIFGKNMLEDQSLLQTYSELLGLSGIKPFICVGEFEEAAQAFHLLKQRPEWQDDFILKTLWPPVPATDAFLVFGEHLIPPLYRKALHAFTKTRL